MHDRHDDLVCWRRLNEVPDDALAIAAAIVVPLVVGGPELRAVYDAAFPG